MPLIHSRVTKSTHGAIVEKAKTRLSAWNAASLTLAGRATLAQSVLSSLPIFAMQTLLLPVSICDELEKLSRLFLWGGGVGDQKVSLVPWDEICVHKLQGGLGLRKQRAMNQAMVGSYQFMFYDMWLSHSEYPRMLETSWNVYGTHQYRLSRKLKRLKRPLRAL